MEREKKAGESGRKVASFMDVLRTRVSGKPYPPHEEDNALQFNNPATRYRMHWVRSRR